MKLAVYSSQLAGGGYGFENVDYHLIGELEGTSIEQTILSYVHPRLPTANYYLPTN